MAVSQDPSMSGSTSDNPFGGGAAQPPENPVKFVLKRNGSTSTLTVQFQDKPGRPTSRAPGAGQI